MFRIQTVADRLWCSLSKLSHIQLETAALSPQAQRDEKHSSPSTAEIKNTWSWTSTPPLEFMIGIELIKHRESFTNTL